MNKLKVKLREPRHVYPKVTVIPLIECGLDDLGYRGTSVAGGSSAGRGLDLDRRHSSDRRRHTTWLLVASHSPRLLVKGGSS